jgi:hypothetical protein
MLSIAFSCPHIPARALQTANEHMIAIVASIQEQSKTIRHRGNRVNSRFFMPASGVEEKAVRNLSLRQAKGNR